MVHAIKPPSTHVPFFLLFNGIGHFKESPYPKSVPGQLGCKSTPIYLEILTIV